MVKAQYTDHHNIINNANISKNRKAATGAACIHEQHWNGQISAAIKSLGVDPQRYQIALQRLATSLDGGGSGSGGAKNSNRTTNETTAHSVCVRRHFSLLLSEENIDIGASFCNAQERMGAMRLSHDR
jgi:hypothetical protein